MIGRYLLPAIALTLLTACASSEEPRYYRLTPEGYTQSSAVAAPDATGEHRARYALGGIGLPQNLDRPELVIVSGANRVEMLEDERWDEPLDSMTRRVLTDDLGLRLGARFDRFPNVEDESERHIAITIDRFDFDSDGTVTLSAWWHIDAAAAPKDAGNPANAHQFTESAQASSRDPGASVAAMSDLFGRLADKIAESAAD